MFMSSSTLTKLPCQCIWAPEFRADLSRDGSSTYSCTKLSDVEIDFLALPSPFRPSESFYDLHTTAFFLSNFFTMAQPIASEIDSATTAITNLNTNQTAWDVPLPTPANHVDSITTAINDLNLNQSAWDVPLPTPEPNHENPTRRTCITCGETFPSRNDLFAHLRQQLSTGTILCCPQTPSNGVACKTCHEKFPSRNVLFNNHLR